MVVSTNTGNITTPTVLRGLSTVLVVNEISASDFETGYDVYHGWRPGMKAIMSHSLSRFRWPL